MKAYQTDQMYIPPERYTLREIVRYVKKEQLDLYMVFMERRRQEKIKRANVKVRTEYHYDCTDLNYGLVERLRGAGL